MSLKKSLKFSKYESMEPPCCLRIHPLLNNIIVIGTYTLRNDATRDGTIDIYSLDKEHSMKLEAQNKVQSAVLDLKFNVFKSNILISAHSTGNIIIWNLDAEAKTLSECKNLQVFDSDVLVTSIFCSPLNEDLIQVTGTSGQVAIVNCSDSSVKMLASKHELECWTGGFGEIGPLSNVVYSGGDDGKLIAHDLRAHDSIWCTNSRHHDAGVVSVLSPSNSWNSQNPSHLWTGSYDDHLRILDLRVIDKTNPELMCGVIPKVASSENLGGGVWRLIPAHDGKRVLACCMYDGARIVEATDDSFEVVRYFKDDHESMCYGGDWAYRSNFVATCSFYDKIIQIWSPDKVSTT